MQDMKTLVQNSTLEINNKRKGKGKKIYKSCYRTYSKCTGNGAI